MSFLSIYDAYKQYTDSIRSGSSWWQSSKEFLADVGTSFFWQPSATTWAGTDLVNVVAQDGVLSQNSNLNLPSLNTTRSVLGSTGTLLLAALVVYAIYKRKR